jgi:acyl carrier protein
MTKEEFLSEMLDVLQRDEAISLDMPLEDIEEWDSLAVMATAAFVHHNFAVRLTMDDFKNMRAVSDIAVAAGLAL